MNGTNSPVDAIAPAVEHVRRVLFRPFDIGKWLILGFLTFLQVLPEYLGQTTGGFNYRPGHFGWEEGQEWVRDAGRWIMAHLASIAIFGFFAILVLLVLVVIFLWLSSRGAFCYLDCIARNRAGIVRPWRENGDLGDSLFFWRLVFSLIASVLLILLVAPVLFSIWKLVTSGEELSLWTVLFGTSFIILVVPILLLQLIVWVVRALLIDFVAPVQYVRRLRCSEAFRVVWQLIRLHPLAFVLYFFLRIVFAILIGVGLFLLGIVVCCATCCIGLIIAVLPVIGHALLQPVFVFKRSFPLFFLRGFGPDFDVFAPGVLGGGPGPAAPPAAPGFPSETPGFPASAPDNPSLTPDSPASSPDPPPSGPMPSRPEGPGTPPEDPIE